jgi:hypothetical protein
VNEERGGKKGDLLYGALVSATGSEWLGFDRTQPQSILGGFFSLCVREPEYRYARLTRSRVPLSRLAPSIHMSLAVELAGRSLYEISGRDFTNGSSP